MKLKYLLAAGLAAALGIGLLPARTWTSADGKFTITFPPEAFDQDVNIQIVKLGGLIVNLRVNM